MSLAYHQRRSADLRFLSVLEVKRIYETLVNDFATTADPMSPAGIRDEGLLESAVGRQQTGLGETLKYPHPVLNASSLTFGLCNDHPFLNGNKRTALVAMLVRKLPRLGHSRIVDFPGGSGESHEEVEVH